MEDLGAPREHNVLRVISPPVWEVGFLCGICNFVCCTGRGRIGQSIEDGGLLDCYNYLKGKMGGSYCGGQNARIAGWLIVFYDATRDRFQPVRLASSFLQRKLSKGFGGSFQLGNGRRHVAPTCVSLGGCKDLWIGKEDEGLR